MSNPFGGGRSDSLYTPLSDLEREFLSRARESGALSVHLHGWGFVESCPFSFGEYRLQIPISITFSAPDVPMPVESFDVEVRVWGNTLHRKTYDVRYGGLPLMIGTGYHLDMVLDLGLQDIDPTLVKTYVPGALGLTSRFQDKDTGDFTLVGNQKFSDEDKRLLAFVRKMEGRVRSSS